MRRATRYISAILAGLLLASCQPREDVPDEVSDGTVEVPDEESSTVPESVEEVSSVISEEIVPGVTGAPDFTVERPSESGKTVSVAKYISETNSGEDNAAGMKKLLSDVKKFNRSSREQVTKIEIPTGTYRFVSEEANTISIVDLDDFVIEGNGAVFIFEEHDSYVQGNFIDIQYCNTLEIRNLTIDWDWEKYPLFVIGEVVSSDPATNSVRFSVEEELPEDMTFRLTFGLGREWDSERDNRSDATGFIQYGSPKSVTRLNAHEVEVVYSTDKSAKNAVPGQQFQFYFQPHHNADAFHLQSTTNVTFENVTVHTAVYTALTSLDSEYLQFLGCHFVPGEGRRFSSYGGLEIHAVRGYVRVENCEFSGILDDNIHLSNHYLGGPNEKVDDHTVRITKLMTWSSKDYIYVGAPLELRDSQFAEKGWRSTVTSFERYFDQTDTTGNQTCYLITFADPLPDNLASTDKFFNPDFYEGKYVIRNNTFYGGTCHAMYIGLSNGTIENNTVDNYGYPSLILNLVQRWTYWYIGTPIDNVVIRNNTFTRCNQAKRDPASVAICAGTDDSPTDYRPVSTHLVTNVLFENNTIDTSTGAALAVFSAENITVRGNRFLNANNEPTTKRRWRGWGSVWVTEAADVFFSDNVFENAADAYENGLYIDSDTTRHILVDGVEQ